MVPLCLRNSYKLNTDILFRVSLFEYSVCKIVRKFSLAECINSAAAVHRVDVTL